jgi:DNA-binding MarR family transcriptional regulator
VAKSSSRIYERHFSKVPIFAAKEGKYSPLPWVLRRVQFLFQPREWQLLTYLVMRCGAESVCWQTDKEIAFDLDIGPKKLPPYMKQLEEDGFIKTAQAEGKRFICVVEPLEAIKGLVAAGKIAPPRLTALNDDLELMGLPTLTGPLPPNVTLLRASIERVPAGGSMAIAAGRSPR